MVKTHILDDSPKGPGNYEVLCGARRWDSCVWLSVVAQGKYEDTWYTFCVDCKELMPAFLIGQ